jgi:hypothetical protein
VFEVIRHHIWRVLVPISVGIVLTVLLFALAGFAGGACHCVTPIAVLFPYTAIARGAFSWESISIVLVTLQYPLYLITIARARDMGWKILTFLILLAFHVAAVTVALRVYQHG